MALAVPLEEKNERPAPIGAIAEEIRGVGSCALWRVSREGSETAGLKAAALTRTDSSKGLILWHASSDLIVE